MSKFTLTSPCRSCPYRRDAPLALWDRQHFVDLLANDKDYLGRSYGCHKNDGQICRGFLMDQDKRGFPSIALRIDMSQSGMAPGYLDTLHCKSALYDSIEEMCEANFPGITNPD